MSTFETIDPEIMFILAKGEPGTRKSTMALSFPGKQYWFSWDRKMSGIYVPFKKWKLPADHLVYDDYDNWTTARKKLETFQVDCPYNTLVFDSLTSMADMTLRQTLNSKGTGGKKIADISVNTIEDFNAESSALQELIALAKDVQGYHAKKGRKIVIIMIAHVVQAEYRDTVKNLTHVSRTIVTAGKKVAPKIPAYCTEVWHFNMDSGFGETADYTFLTTHVGDDYARTSIDLPAKVVFNDKQVYKDFIKPAIDKLKV